MSPTEVIGKLQFHEPTSRPQDYLYTCDNNACKALEQEQDEVNRQTEMGLPKYWGSSSPTEDVMPGGKYAQRPWDASSELVNRRPSLYFPHHR